MPRHSMSKWEAAFKAADRDRNGTLDRKELRALFKQHNCNLTESQLNELFVYFDGPRGDQRITLSEFVAGLERVDTFVKSVESLFNKFDADRSGYLDRSEMKRLLESSGHRFTQPEVIEIMKRSDKNGDGKISLQELLDAFT
ncbi:unnamed protein product [Lymnaea stagnalis]|uniref:EF-hand domain-containing protein n=1 Tax=Lymnaea stagnalis TaxID=6523 RepID=A0AAV2HAT5_LYMST